MISGALEELDDIWNFDIIVGLVDPQVHSFHVIFSVPNYLVGIDKFNIRQNYYIDSFKGFFIRKCQMGDLM